MKNTALAIVVTLPALKVTPLLRALRLIATLKEKRHSVSCHYYSKAIVTSYTLHYYAVISHYDSGATILRHVDVGRWGQPRHVTVCCHRQLREISVTHCLRHADAITLHTFISISRYDATPLPPLLLSHHGRRQPHFAEGNGRIFPRDEYAATYIKRHDIITLIQPLARHYALRHTIYAYAITMTYDTPCMITPLPQRLR